MELRQALRATVFIATAATIIVLSREAHSICSTPSVLLVRASPDSDLPEYLYGKFAGPPEAGLLDSICGGPDQLCLALEVDQ